MIKLIESLKETYPQMIINESFDIIANCQNTGRSCLAVNGEEISPIITGTQELGIIIGFSPRPILESCLRCQHSTL